jgi:type IV pilus assembly protein PilE
MGTNNVCRHRQFCRLRSARGFTLAEIMVAMAIIAILVAVAIPVYQSQVRSARRADAKNALLDLAARQERYFTANNTYTSTAGDLGYAGSYPVSFPSATQTNYAVSVTAASASSYTAQAVPNGDQANDSCGTYTLTSTGAQANSGNTLASASCW